MDPDQHLHADNLALPRHATTESVADEEDPKGRRANDAVEGREVATPRKARQPQPQDRTAAATNELERRQAFADAVVETIDVGIVSCDAAGGHLRRNRAQREMLGLPSPLSEEDEQAAAFEVRGEDGTLLAPQDYPLMRALRGEVIHDLELSQGPPGGPMRDILVRGRQMLAPDGTVTGAVIAVTDVTVSRQASRELAEEREQLAEAKRIGRLGSFSYDPAAGAFSMSARLRQLWGLPADGAVEGLARAAIHPGDAPRTAKAFQTALATGGRHTWTFRIERPTDRSLRHMSAAVEVVHDNGGHPVKVTGTHQDVTELVEAEQRAIQARNLFEAILSATPDYTFVTDLATDAVSYGSSGKELLGLNTEQLQESGPHALTNLSHSEDRERVQSANADAAHLADGEVLQTRYRAFHADGSCRWVSRRVTPFKRDSRTGRVIEVLGVIRDVTDVVQAEENLTHAALHDALTGLPNRALLMDRLDGALARIQRTNRRAAVLFCDLDGFKRINDTSGHAVGDLVLVEIADRLRRVLRPQDTLARVGGDEFVILVEPWERDGAPRTTTAVEDHGLATALAQRILEALRRPVVMNGSEYSVSGSVGITYAGGRHDRPAKLTSDELLQEADAAMYRAKNLGKDRFEVFEHGLRASLIERGRVEQILRRAIAKELLGLGEVVVPPRPSGRAPRPEQPHLGIVYQPVVDSDSGLLVGFEALARLTDADGLTIEPELFIDVAETTGIIRDLGLIMLDRACAQLAYWKRSARTASDLTIAVNISALQASHSFLCSDVRDALQRHQLKPGDLILELTETALLEAGRSTLAALRLLHDDGVGIAIDDFGTGYASLRYLAILPVTAVKIDKTFTAGLPNDITSKKIVRAVAALAADLGLACIVEGVETPAQKDALPAGVKIQGYLTGKPAAPESVDLDALRLSSKHSVESAR